MNETLKLLAFVKPYWKRAVLALVLLTTLVFLDLSIPRLIQRLIDQGINQQNQQVVIQTSIVMLMISLVSLVIAIGNNVFSVQVGEATARDVREALFLKIQALSFANLDQMQTGQLMVRLSSDSSAFQRLVQISLRIGTRAPAVDDRQPDPDVRDQPQPRAGDTAPLDRHLHLDRVLHLEDGAAVPIGAPETR